MQKVTAYKCSFCKDGTAKLFMSRSGCAHHEKRCWLNPARKSCATCIHIDDGIDEEQWVVKWSCLAGLTTPFKQKVVNCPLWGESGTIFANDEPLMNRPVERHAR